jgi:ankyrin repeat protein
MKKSIIYLGVALFAFSSFTYATTATHSVVNLVSTTPNASPLCVAISKGDFDTVKKFIEYGANVNEVKNGMTPLMVAARYNNVEIVSYLLEKGANKKIKDDKGNTALKHAQNSKASAVIELLK